MATKLTRQILEAYLNCKFKAHLKLGGQQGSTSDYEALLISNRKVVRQQAIGKILERNPEGEVARDVALTVAALRTAPSYLLDTTFEDDLFCLQFDGLRRVDGPSKLGDFQYVPMLFHEGQKVGKEQRLLLEVYGLVLSRLQGQMPSNGIVWHGRERRTTKVRLNRDLPQTERLLREVKEMVNVQSPPKLMLNDHCQICGFRQRCHDQATKEDDISLLRGMGEKEIKSYARKGIFTVTQLAHTFRPRRKGKRTSSTEERHHHALQALAVRDKKVYVLGSAQLSVSKVNVYLDVEGCPDDRLDYLIGVLITDGDSVESHSFWANDNNEQDQVFEQFLDAVAYFDDFRVFCYGSYEKVFLQKMRMRSNRKNLVDRVLSSLVNTLSVIYPHIYFPTYSNGLKEVASCLGCTWTDPNASGIQSITWRRRWENTNEETWKQRLIVYNLEDCEALKRVTEFIHSHCLEATPTSRRLSNPQACPAIARVHEIANKCDAYKWGHTRFLNPDFTYINAVSHFDYQRDRVYVRTSRKLRKTQTGKHHNRQLPVSVHLEITPENCPQCKGEKFIVLPTDNRTNKLYTKRAFDLVITSGKIRRRVIECHGAFYRCQQCGYQSLDRSIRRASPGNHHHHRPARSQEAVSQKT